MSSGPGSLELTLFVLSRRCPSDLRLVRPNQRLSQMFPLGLLARRLPCSAFIFVSRLCVWMLTTRSAPWMYRSYQLIVCDGYARHCIFWGAHVRVSVRVTQTHMLRDASAIASDAVLPSESTLNQRWILLNCSGGGQEFTYGRQYSQPPTCSAQRDSLRDLILSVDMKQSGRTSRCLCQTESGEATQALTSGFIMKPAA